MNTVKSFWIGMGTLCVAGGTTYYFAKQSINADRAARFEREQKRRQVYDEMERSSSYTSSVTAAPSNGGPPRADTSGSPSQEAGHDPAPTRHAPDSEGQRVREKSKYETSEPFRSRKGDRFS